MSEADRSRQEPPEAPRWRLGLRARLWLPLIAAVVVFALAFALFTAGLDRPDARPSLEALFPALAAAALLSLLLAGLLHLALSRELFAAIRAVQGAYGSLNGGAVRGGTLYPPTDTHRSQLALAKRLFAEVSGMDR